MSPRRNKTTLVPSELQGVATTADVDVLGERIDRCYSSERYENFQDAVEKIIDRYVKGRLGWAVLIWLATLIGSMLLQKFFNVF